MKLRQNRSKGSAERREDKGRPRAPGYSEREARRRDRRGGRSR